MTQSTIATTICVSGWTDTIRPPVSYTNALKRQQMMLYGVTGQALSEYEEDHYFPLTAGGAPRDPNNLFPQPIAIARLKDVKERQINADICTGRKTLSEAQSLWQQGWQAYH